MELENRVQEVLNEIRPQLQADCGDAQLIGVDDDGMVRVKLIGACPMSQMTLKMGIERLLKQEVPEVKEVINV